MGKGAKKSSTPVVQSDTLRTKQKLSVLDLVSEGPIKGFATDDIAQSTYLNGTAVKNADGVINISGVTIAANLGTADQSYLEGFKSSDAELTVGVDVKFGVPLVRTITRDVDRLRLTLGGDSLYSYETNGDMNRTDLKLRVDVLIKGNWEEKARLDLIDQKSESEWLLPVEITDLPAPPFDVRVVRETADSTNSRLRNGSFWRSYTEIHDTKQSFPYCAVVGMTIDSEQFGSSPTRTYLLDGIICQVPDNYDPITRTYSGFWSGNFKPAWTNNPAWIYYEIASNEIFGCGDFITPDMLDIYALYALGKYCDELVDDGFGGTEPRFVCNGYLTEQRKAQEVLSDLASIFNGMPVWLGTINSVSVDFPGDIVAQYTNANVIGDFQYSSTELGDRHSVVEVSYCDPNNNYEKAIEYVSDQALINRYGYNLKKVTAFCTTSRGQARRLGLYILESEKQETRAVTFKTGIQGLRNVPGDLIEIADNSWSGVQMGGRIRAVSEDGLQITIDRDIQADSPINFNGNEQVYIGVLEDRTFKKVRVTNITDINVCHLEQAVFNVLPDRVYSITRVNVQPRTFRCLDVKFDQKKKEFDVSAVQHAARKYSDIDNNVYFGPDANTGSIYGGIPSVKNITVDFENYTADSNIIAKWDCPTAGTNIRYRVRITRYDLVYFAADIDSTSLRLKINDQGNYTIQITCVSIADNRQGIPNTLSFTIGPPTKVQSISWTASNFEVSLRPVTGPISELGDQYQWFFGATEAEVKAMTNYLGRAWIMNKGGLKPNYEYWFGCRTINPLGVSEVVTVKTKTILNSDDLLAVIAPDIPNIDYIKQMNQDITGLQQLASLRVVDPNGTNPRVSGVYVNSGDASIGRASVVDILADYFAISSPDTYERWVYFNTSKRMLTILGDIQAKSGTMDNVTINENCVIKGKLTVAQIDGDLYTRQQGLKSNIIINDSDSQVNHVFMTINGQDFIRILETNYTIRCQTSWREYFNFEMSDNGGAWYPFANRWDSGNDGGTHDVVVSMITVPNTGVNGNTRFRIRTEAGRNNFIRLFADTDNITVSTTQYNGVSSAYRKGKEIVTQIG